MSIAVCLAGSSAEAAELQGPILRALGAALAEHFAKYLPTPAPTVTTDPRGGQFCDVLAGYRWPPPITVTDQMNPALKRAVLGALQHGAEFCGWRPN